MDNEANEPKKDFYLTVRDREMLAAHHERIQEIRREQQQAAERKKGAS